MGAPDREPPEDILAMQLRALRASHAKIVREPLRRIACLDDAPAGAVLLDLAPGEIVHVAEVAVMPFAQRRGVGTALLHDAISLAEGRALELSVDQANAPALALYERHGFREVAADPVRFRMRRPAAA